MKTRFHEITESAFQRQVVEMAQLLRWEWLHVSASPQVNRGVVTKYTTPTHGTMGKGWVDLILVRQKDKRLIFAELKSEIGKASPEQRRVLEVLGSLVVGVGMQFSPLVEVHLWRPSDIDEIARILA